MKKTQDICVRLSPIEHNKIKENTKKFGFHNVSQYMRFVGLNTLDITIKTKLKNE